MNFCVHSNKVLDQTGSAGEAGFANWYITLCNLLAWVVICLSLIKGVKSIGKVTSNLDLHIQLILSIFIQPIATVMCLTQVTVQQE